MHVHSHTHTHFLEVAWACLALSDRNAIPWSLARFRDFVRTTEPGRGPHLLRAVQAGPLRAPQPRVREKIRGRKRKVLYSGKSQFYTYYSNISYYTEYLIYHIICI